MQALTAKQEAFCHEYLVDYNPAQAALRAGYDGNNLRKTGLSLRGTPAIRKRISALIKERNENLLIAEEYIVDTLVEVITRCLQAEPVKTYNAQQKVWVATGEWKFDPADAIKAIDVLAKYIGMNAQQRLTDARKAIDTKQGLSVDQFNTLITAVRGNAGIPDTDKWT
jgi:phage terminase small subunit